MMKFFKKEKNFNKNRESLWLNINFYWKISVLIMFVVFCFSISFGYYFFIQKNKEPYIETNNTNTQADTVKKERIDKVLEYFSLRKQKSDRILISPAPIVDPSL